MYTLGIFIGNFWVTCICRLRVFVDNVGIRFFRWIGIWIVFWRWVLMFCSARFFSLLFFSSTFVCTSCLFWPFFLLNPGGSFFPFVYMLCVLEFSSFFVFPCYFITPDFPPFFLFFPLLTSVQNSCLWGAGSVFGKIFVEIFWCFSVSGL